MLKLSREKGRLDILSTTSVLASSAIVLVHFPTLTWLVLLVQLGKAADRPVVDQEVNQGMSVVDCCEQATQ